MYENYQPPIFLRLSHTIHLSIEPFNPILAKAACDSVVVYEALLRSVAARVSSITDVQTSHPALARQTKNSNSMQFVVHYFSCTPAP